MTVEEQERAACRHYWVIEVADGPVSNGVCRGCNAVRVFKNYIEQRVKPEDAISLGAEEFDLRWVPHTFTGP